MLPPEPVLKHFGPALAELSWQRAPAGFSGAEVWRGDDSGQAVFALKAWPPEFPAARLAVVHGWMARAAHLPFVPTVLPASDGRSVVAEAARAWDVTRWMPGTPRETPSIAEVEAACAAVARLHAAWRTAAPPEPCRGVLNRLRLLREWLSAPVRPGPSLRLTPEIDSLARRAVELVARAAPGAVVALERWEHVALPVQPCVRDLRAEHVLFVGGRIAGVIDFGAMAEDHPAVDLARLLGDYAVESELEYAASLRAYRGAGGELDTPDDFVRQLAVGGAFGSAIIWLRRLYNPQRPYPVTRAVEARLALLVHGIERFAPN